MIGAEAGLFPPSPALFVADKVKVYSVPSGSMENTLEVGDRMLVNRTAYPDGMADSQDVVVFTANEDWAHPMPPEGAVENAVRTFGDLTGIGRSHEQALVKRVIGVGGDHVTCCDASGRVTVNGEALDEPYLYPGAAPSDIPFDVTVPDGKITRGLPYDEEYAPKPLYGAIRDALAAATPRR